eukprot:COSAG02_NODE_39602_length_415_cov_0.813291_2_plen_72_part_01
MRRFAHVYRCVAPTMTAYHGPSFTVWIVLSDRKDEQLKFTLWVEMWFSSEEDCLYSEQRSGYLRRRLGKVRK